MSKIKVILIDAGAMASVFHYLPLASQTVRLRDQILEQTINK
jgi:hypothetical protein